MVVIMFVGLRVASPFWGRTHGAIGLLGRRVMKINFLNRIVMAAVLCAVWMVGMNTPISGQDQPPQDQKHQQRQKKGPPPAQQQQRAPQQQQQQNQRAQQQQQNQQRQQA